MCKFNIDENRRSSLFTVSIKGRKLREEKLTSISIYIPRDDPKYKMNVVSKIHMWG